MNGVGELHSTTLEVTMDSFFSGVQLHFTIDLSKLFEIFLKKGLQFQNGCGIITKPSDEAANRIVGVDYNEGPPVPIPNTEVKLSGAENTWLVTAREDREMPTQSIHPNGCFALYSSIAQSVVRVYRNVPETIT